jgi:hypothetical protein
MPIIVQITLAVCQGSELSGSTDGMRLKTSRSGFPLLFSSPDHQGNGKDDGKSS